MLHAEATQAQQRRAYACAEAAAAKLARELAGATFRPHLTSGNAGAASSPWWHERLACDPRRATKEARLEALRREQEQAELADCTFTPRSNHNCSSSSSNCTCCGPEWSPPPRQLLLYHEAAHRLKRLDKTRQEQAQREARQLFRPRTLETEAARAAFARRMRQLEEQSQDGVSSSAQEQVSAVVRRVQASVALGQEKRRTAREDEGGGGKSWWGWGWGERRRSATALA
jgi:hypothetical protein